MAINPGNLYPGKTTAPSADYPFGGARNVSTPGDGTGTPWEAALVNDLFGFQQALLDGADITPAGTPERVGQSQYLDALRRLFTPSGVTVTDVGGGSNATLNEAEAAARVLVFEGELTANIAVIVPDRARDWIVINDTTGAFDLTLRTSGGSGFALQQGEYYGARSDGTNVVKFAGTSATRDMATPEQAREGSADAVLSAATARDSYGQFGLGSGKRVDSGNLNDFKQPGFYFVSDAVSNKPTSQGGTLTVSGGDIYWSQIFIDRNAGAKFHRTFVPGGGGSWTDWDSGRANPQLQTHDKTVRRVPLIRPSKLHGDDYRRTDLGVIIPPSTGYVFTADPFAIVVPEHDRLYVFYEEFEDVPGESNRGVISVAYSDDGETFTRDDTLSPVIDRLASDDIHHSYPSLIRIDDTFYMLADGKRRSDDALRHTLYKTTLNQFPGGWVEVGLPAALNTFGGGGDFDSTSIADPTIFEANGMICAFYGGNGNNQLGLAACPRFNIENMGQWMKAPTSRENKGFVIPSELLGVRPGGDVIPVGDNAFYTSLQVNEESGLYAEGQSLALGFFRIGLQDDGFRPVGYHIANYVKEDVGDNNIFYLTPTGIADDWDRTHVHHLSVVRFKGKWLGVYDGRNTTDFGSRSWRIGLIEIPEPNS